MTMAELIALLQDTQAWDSQVFLCPNAEPVDGVEFCPGDPLYDLDPYIILRSA